MGDPSPQQARRARTGLVIAGALASALAIADLAWPGPVWAAAFVAAAALGVAAFLAGHRRGGARAAGAARARAANAAPAEVAGTAPGDAPAGAPEAGGAGALAPRPSLGGLLAQGLYMGVSAFGGAMAVVAQIDRELVGRLRWVSSEAFTEAAAFGQSLPGAVANNALALLGFRLGGWPGAALLVGGYVLPSFLLMLTFALAYERLRAFVVVDGALAGLSPAVAAVVGGVTWSLFQRMVGAARPGEVPRAAVRAKGRVIVAVVAAVAVAWLGVGAPEVILACGFISLARLLVAPRLTAFLPVLPVALPAAAHAGRIGAFGEVIGVFLRTGATTFGGGYVMVPVLERELVRTGWISSRAFVDAVALGQITPGPVVITATFVGYQLAGLAGALFGTVAVFGPGFVLAMVLAGSIDRVRSHPAMRAFLAGLQPAIVGVMAAAVVALARSGIRGWPGAALALVAFALLATKRLGVGRVLIGSALLGVALRLFHVHM